MAHKKAAGSTRLGRDSESKRLGVKRFGGTAVAQGEVLIRQRGTKYHAGQNVGRGADDTLFAMTPGVVMFHRKKHRRFTNGLRSVQFIHVVPTTAEVVEKPKKAKETEEATQ